MSVEIEPENFDSSGTGCKQSGEHLDRGRFPCAVGAQEAEELSGSNAQVHAVHGNEFSETAGQALSADGGGKIHQFSESSTPTGFSRGDYLSFFGASFFSGCFFCISSVQGGTIPTTRAYAIDCPRCSAVWRTIKSRTPRSVFFPPNQSMLFSRSVSGMTVIAFLAWAKESFIVTITFALSVVDFSRPFISIPVGAGVPTSL